MRSPGTSSSTPTSRSRPAADDDRAPLEDVAEREHRALGPRFLDEAEERVQEHDRRDRRRLDPLADQRGDESGTYQQSHERIGELAKRDRTVGRPVGARELVRPEPSEARLCLGLAQAMFEIAGELSATSSEVSACGAFTSICAQTSARLIRLRLFCLAVARAAC